MKNPLQSLNKNFMTSLSEERFFLSINKKSKVLELELLYEPSERDKGEWAAKDARMTSTLYDIFHGTTK